MAEITAPSEKKQKGVRRAKKASTRIDFTPMVDLGFLLITFFMVANAWEQLKSMRLIMPADGPEMPVGDNTALTVIPLDSNRVFYYFGELNKAMEGRLYGFADYSIQHGIGNIIRKRQQALKEQKGDKSTPFLIIKPSRASDLGNLVDVMDEVLINAVRSYSLTEISEEEISLLHKLGIRAV